MIYLRSLRPGYTLFQVYLPRPGGQHSAMATLHLPNQGSSVHVKVNPGKEICPACRFCVHEHTLFGPWHRPYCMLFEQHLLSACNTVAARFTDQKRKQQAKLTCGKLRAPFWDATIADSPSLLVDQSVRVYDSSGSKMVTISNPLQSYCFRVSYYRDIC